MSRHHGMLAALAASCLALSAIASAQLPVAGHRLYVEKLAFTNAVNGERDQTYVVALIPDGGRLILVEATGEAESFKAHPVRAYFDGQERLVQGTNFTIDEVHRGVHNIQVEVIDNTGKLMIRSQPNRFYVQQNIVKR